MDTVLQAMLTWQFIFFCLAIFAITLVIRRAAEYIFAHTKIHGAIFWRDVLLPSLPIIIGVLFALVAKQYPYPIELHYWSGRFAWGLVSGLLSGLVYRPVNAFIQSYIVSKVPNAIVIDSNLDPSPNADEEKR